MPAMNCASPPNIAANGARASGDFGVPHQPARLEATMNVAPANPARPRIDGAAIGCRKTRVPNPFDDSGTPAEAVARLSSSVLILASFYNGLRSIGELIPGSAARKRVNFFKNRSLQLRRA